MSGVLEGNELQNKIFQKSCKKLMEAVYRMYEYDQELISWNKTKKLALEYVIQSLNRIAVNKRLLEQELPITI